MPTPSGLITCPQQNQIAPAASPAQRIPPVSLRSRVGMTRGVGGLATFVGSTFVCIAASGVGAILLTAVG
jgi:hypothetical protein